MLETVVSFIKNNSDLISIAVGLYALFKSDSAKKIASNVKREILNKNKSNLINEFLNECNLIQQTLIQYKERNMPESAKRDILKHISFLTNKKQNLKNDSIEQKISNLYKQKDNPEDLYKAICQLISDLNLIKQDELFS
ncbi:hypothetical protein [Fibrobacter sp.]|uniref:hypothetical protein n=1 Tax=Fibrobacter sp. TaxID=35828 RepID=UPI0025BDEF06|nr:hypothetical protein [Fibrobacter sp.]MBQ9226862.1 hypothetical protein [Fibrobacter sp.]